MSSGAKRLVQSLRDRGGGSGGGRSRDDGGAGSTSATRLFHYDSGHELDEISVIGRTNDELATTPTTPYHHASQASQAQINKYGSGQTLYSIAGSMQPSMLHTQATSLGRVTPAGLYYLFC